MYTNCKIVVDITAPILTLRTMKSDWKAGQVVFQHATLEDLTTVTQRAPNVVKEFIIRGPDWSPEDVEPREKQRNIAIRAINSAMGYGLMHAKRMVEDLERTLPGATLRVIIHGED